jgi:hypothetical protein
MSRRRRLATFLLPGRELLFKMWGSSLFFFLCKGLALRVPVRPDTPRDIILQKGYKADM